jgi:acetyltransferase-like isoleucine patch superfamily enzyme
MLLISNEAHISDKADIEDSVRGSTITICRNVTIDSFVKIKPVGGIGDIHIGEGTYINSGAVLFSGNGIRIGKNVLIAPCCALTPVNHAYEDKNRTIVEQRFGTSHGGLLIPDDVWIGANTTILDGVIIETGAVIGANSLVRNDMHLEAYGIYAGNPLRKIGERE